MSGYKDGEALWLTRVRAVSGFDTSNTSRGNWTILNNGAADIYAILKPGEWNREMIGFNRRLNVYQTIIQVWQKYREDGTSMINLEDKINDILVSVDTYPQIGDSGNTVIDAQIIAVREVQQTPADAPTWMYAELVGEWQEEIAITYVE